MDTPFTLNPGPSQLSQETKDDIRRAIDEHILSLSHRSSAFTDISKRCIQGLREFLQIPQGYRVFYFDSATHIWHALAANCVEKHSYHFVNGAFSKRAREAFVSTGMHTVSDEVPWGTQNDFDAALIPEETELITACYNETSTGVAMRPEEVTLLHRKYPDALLAIDITSCAGAVELPIAEADVWYFSVQKAFGLPAGLGIAIISERAFARSIELTHKGANTAGLWSWQRLDDALGDEKYFTPHTPNVLNIYLLATQCERFIAAGGIRAQEAETREKQRLFNEWLRAQSELNHFCADATHRSPTVFTISADPERIKTVKASCEKLGITLGSGYGDIKAETFRLANFPAITKDMLKEALACIESTP